jgi:hypothetical protein
MSTAANHAAASIRAKAPATQEFVGEAATGSRCASPCPALEASRAELSGEAEEGL